MNRTKASVRFLVLKFHVDNRTNRTLTTLRYKIEAQPLHTNYSLHNDTSSRLAAWIRHAEYK